MNHLTILEELRRQCYEANARLEQRSQQFSAVEAKNAETIAQMRSELEMAKRLLDEEQKRHATVLDDYQAQVRIVAKEREEIARLREELRDAQTLARAPVIVAPAFVRRRVVSETSKAWNLRSKYDTGTETISKSFQILIERHRDEGMALESWHMAQSFSADGSVVMESIVGVFVELQDGDAG